MYGSRLTHLLSIPFVIIPSGIRAPACIHLPVRRGRYRELQADIVQEEASHTINFITIDCTQLKSALVGHCTQWQAKLTGLLNQVHGRSRLRQLA